MSDLGELDILKTVILQNLYNMLANTDVKNKFEEVYKEMQIKCAHEELFELIKEAYDIQGK